MHRFVTLTLCAAMIAVVGCSSENGHGTPKVTKVTKIAPGADAQTKLQEALINAKPGEVIELAEGKYDFNQTVSLDAIDGVTIRGAGPGKTVISYGQQIAGGGGEGIKVDGCKNFAIEGLTIEDTRGDGIKTTKCEGVVYRNLLIQWTRGPHPDNGAYGVYPVLCQDVLIEDCKVTDCSDAGVYVGQSKNCIVRRCHAERNVAGIEIENTIGADVYDNVATDNAGGLLIFSLPGLEQKVGSQCRCYKNQVFANNHENFAKPGNIVATVPPGTGMIIMANDQVEVFDNDIKDNNTSNLSIISYMATGVKTRDQLAKDDPGYDPYPEGIYIHDNRIADGGKSPGGEFGKVAKAILGEDFPDILYDGVVDETKFVDGKPREELRVVIVNNGNADFSNFNYGALASGDIPKPNGDLAPHAGSLPPLPAITIPGME
ncbi:MAG: right-handed parallel beta-helix repeat-containing protein [Pirellulales bacterium]|nr:right-handed parallel beta-helix repeat-containing protein [Pirellulales bacterium]